MEDRSTEIIKKEIAKKEKRNNEDKDKEGWSIEHGRMGIIRKEKTRARGTSCRKTRDAM